MKMLIPLFAGLLLLCAQGAFAGTVDKTVKASTSGEVHISNVAGSIKVNGWSKNEVHVSGTLGEDTEPLEIQSVNGQVEIRVRIKDDRNEHHHDDAAAHLVIQIPAANRLRVSTVSADIEVAGVTGEQEIGSVSGNVTLTSKAKDISAKSISGDVTVTGSAKDAEVTVRSISGKVKARNVMGELDAGTVSGDLNIADCTLSRAEVKSTSGDVNYTAALRPNGRYRFHNVSGDIALNFGAKPDARFDLSTFSGDIRNSFGPKPEPSGEYTPGHKLRFTNGKGSAEVRVSAMSGDISLHD